MSHMAKRALTAEEKAIAKRLKLIFKTSPDRTEEAAGEACGVSQGQVSHWTGGREPVPAKRAAAFAAYMGVADPGEISVGYREAALPASPSGEARQVDELRHIMSAMTTVMLAYRQHEGDAFLQLLRKIPTRADPDSYARELIEVLERALGVSSRPVGRPHGR